MAGDTKSTLTLVALAGIGFATGGAALPALAGAAGSGAAAGGAAAAASGFSMSSALMGASTFLTAGTAVMGAAARETAQLFQEGQAKLKSAGEQTQAAVEEQNRQLQLRSMLSTQNAIFGAANISGGVAGTVASKTLSDFNREGRLAASQSRLAQAQYANEAQGASAAAKSARTTGYAQAGGTLLRFAGEQYDTRSS